MICKIDDVPRIGTLFSGGLDSAILLADLLRQGYRVQPFYVRTGTRWESAERTAVNRFLSAIDCEKLQSLVELEMPVSDLYGNHWSLGEELVPSEECPDESVYLLGRTPLLLLKAAIWCSENGISKLSLATLSSNPFEDNSPEFFQNFESMIEIATGSRVDIVLPFSDRTKEEVLRLGASLPLDLTFSCLAPVDGRHCGQCNKCGERKKAFASLALKDVAFPNCDVEVALP